MTLVKSLVFVIRLVFLSSDFLIFVSLIFICLFCRFLFFRGSTCFCGIFYCFSCFIISASFLNSRTSSILAAGGGLVLLPSLAANSTSAMEGETTTPTKTTPSLIGSNWPSLPIPGDTQETEVSKEIEDSPIQPAQKSPTAWKGQQRGPEEYEKDRVGRFAKYFKGNEILPIPEIADKITPRVLSLVVSDLKTKRLVGLTEEVFEELLRKAGIPCQYFCRKSFAT